MDAQSQPALWSSQQLTEFLTAVSSAPDEPSLLRDAVEYAAEALEAEVGAIVLDGHVRASVGFPSGWDVSPLADERPPELVDVPGVGLCRPLETPIEGSRDRLIVARFGEEHFTREEAGLLRGMGRAVALTLRAIRTLEAERLLREQSDRQAAQNATLAETLSERQLLLERLSRIQQSISHRAELQVVLDAIVQGAHELIGDEIVGLRLVDETDANVMEMVASEGFSQEILDASRFAPLGHGAGGRAILEDRVVVVEDYSSLPEGFALFVADGLQTAMAAPVRQQGVVIGSLTVGSKRGDRRYSPSEQDVLQALADHASIAISDARAAESLRKTAQREREAAERLRALDEMKNAILTAVSHELRTPLAVLMGAAHTLLHQREKLSPEKTTNLLERLVANGVRLERLLGDLLDLDRLDRGILEPRRAPTDLLELVERVQSAAELGTQNHISIDVPHLVADVDAAKVERIIENLLLNAVKHTPPGTPIRIHAWAADDGVVIAVDDEGQGVSETEAEAIFQPFVQLRGGTVDAPGVGVGLSLVQRFAELHGGTAWVETAGSGGASFRVYLPAKITQPT